MAPLLLGATAVMPPTAHLVTIATHRRRFVLLGDPRAIAGRELGALPQRCPGMAIDCAVFLPDRVHAILRLTDPPSPDLAAIVQSYKAATTKTIKSVLAIDRVWDRGFEHRVIRDEAELIAVRASLKAQADYRPPASGGADVVRSRSSSSATQATRKK